MPKAIVHILETIQIQEQYRIKVAAIPPASFDNMFETIDKE